MTTTSLILLSFTSAVFGAEAIPLAANGKTEYEIVVTDKPAAQVGAAARELAVFLNQVTGAEFPIVKASYARGEYQIVVGRSDALASLNLPIDWESLGPEGFVIRTVGTKLVIAGGPRRGTINAVYTFLEDVAGCRWYTPDFSVIPRNDVLTVGPLNIRTVPAFKSRQIWRYMVARRTADADWSARQRLNMLQSHRWDELLDNPKLADCMSYVVSFGHTLGYGRLVPYTEFAEHPEYFALIDGKRAKEGLCMTNPDVIPVIVRSAKRWIENDPNGQILSISQVDGAFELTGCQCHNCKAAFEQYGKAGVYIRLVNQVAAGLEEDHPDILIDTFSYYWTRKPPKVDMKMHENGVVRYCTGGGICIHHPMDQCSFNTSKDPQTQLAGAGEVYEDLVNWTRISPRVWVWYYVHGGDKMHPVPHFFSLSRNFKRMRDAGVQGIFVQDTNSSEIIDSGGLLDLQSYLLAKLMWDPDYDVLNGIQEFCRACYGAAAPQMVSFVKYGQRCRHLCPHAGMA